MRVSILLGSLAVLWLAVGCGGGDGGGNGPAGGKDTQGTEALAEVLAETGAIEEAAPAEPPEDAQVVPEAQAESLAEPGAEPQGEPAVEFGPEVQAEALPEVAEGSGPADGVDACAALDACVAANCAAEVASGSQIKKTACSLKSCQADYEACYGSFGGGACKDLLKCAQGCQNPECQNGCMSSASYEANLQFLDMGICMEDNCPDALENPMANIGCITGVCGAPLNTCCGGSLMGCM